MIIQEKKKSLQKKSDDSLSNPENNVESINTHLFAR